MSVKEKFYKATLKKKTTFLTKIILIYLLLTSIAYADLKKDLINKLILTETLTFDFIQKIDEKEEIGNCFGHDPDYGGPCGEFSVGGFSDGTSYQRGKCFGDCRCGTGYARKSETAEC